MNYINKLFSYSNLDEFKYTFQFQITHHSDNDYFLEINVIDRNDIIETVSNIKLDKGNNHVFRSENIYFDTELLYECYKVKFASVLLKFKNDILSPVSTLFVTCTCNCSDKKRLFALTLEDIKSHSPMGP